MKRYLKNSNRSPLPHITFRVLLGIILIPIWGIVNGNTSGPTAALAATAQLVATNSPQMPGASFLFSGSGFSEDETISAWITAPDGTVTALRSTTAGEDGHLAYTVNTLASYKLGQWYLTLHGLSSRLEAVAPFELVNARPVAPPPATSPAAPPPPIGPTVPQGGLQVAPSTDFAGQPFQISGSGFAPNEIIRLWETDPQRTAVALTSINSDAKGNITFTYKSHGPLAGIWAVTAHGLVSGVEKTGYLQLVIYSRGVAALAIGPNHGDINTSIDVHGYYFYQHEPYSYWATSPDGTVYAGKEDEAAQDGSLFFHYFIPAVKPGRWAITVHGLYSTSEAIAYFTYDNP